VSPEADVGRTGALWQSLVGSDVVLDTDTSFVYVGRLEAADNEFLTLTNVDVHDMNDSRATKEVYALEALKHGVRANRRKTFVRVSRVVSVSRLEDVVRY
jgi:hypothetical protein